jgi:hypothetical protein
MGGSDDFVVLPPLAVAVLPGARLIGDDPVPVSEGVDLLPKERQPVKEVAHPFPCELRLRAGRGP